MCEMCVSEVSCWCGNCVAIVGKACPHCHHFRAFYRITRGERKRQ